MTLYRPFSPKFPYLPENFVGREDDVKELMELIDFSDDESADIISIVGSPGIGKTALAVYVGNEMILNRVVVHYVNMKEFPNEHLKQEIAERIFGNLASQSDKPANVTFDKLLKWAGNKFWYNLIVLDDCDDCINSQKEEFQDTIDKLLFFSDSIKILMTSREIIVHSENYHTYQLKPLSEESACEFLDFRLSSVLNGTEKEAIAELTGAMPLALKIIGSLLSKVNHPTPAEVIAKLKSSPISALSSPKLARSMRLNNSIWLSYDYLSKELQGIGRYLAHFPSFFEKHTACSVLKLIFNNSGTELLAAEEYLAESLIELVEHSLLEFDELSQRYHFHRLIKDFFLCYSSLNESERFRLAFQEHFASKLCEIDAVIKSQNTKKGLTMLDTERHNIRYFMMIIQKPVSLSHNISYIFAVNCFASAVEHQYLRSLFSPSELIGPIESATNIVHGFSTQLINDTDLNEEYAQQFFSDFMKLFTSLVSLIEILEGRDQALDRLLEREHFVEEVSNSGVSGIVTPYMTFYASILCYQNHNDNSTKLYLERMLKKIYDPNFCNLNDCDYFSVGNAYYRKHLYPESIKFYELAIQNDSSRLFKS